MSSTNTEIINVGDVRTITENEGYTRILFSGNTITGKVTLTLPATEDYIIEPIIEQIVPTGSVAWVGGSKNTWQHGTPQTVYYGVESGSVQTFRVPEGITVIHVGFSWHLNDDEKGYRSNCLWDNDTGQNLHPNRNNDSGFYIKVTPGATYHFKVITGTKKGRNYGPCIYWSPEINNHSVNLTDIK